MTKKELRIAIAQDVIKSLRRLNPKEGAYVKFHNEKDFENVAKAVKWDSRKTANRIKKHCEVCALGACFLSSVVIENNWDFSKNPPSNDRWGKPDERLYQDEEIKKKLAGIFTLSQMGRIEAAFERGDCGMFLQGGIKEDVAAEFGRKFTTPRARLKAIMKNIIENDGTFNP